MSHRSARFVDVYHLHDDDSRGSADTSIAMHEDLSARVESLLYELSRQWIDPDEVLFLSIRDFEHAIRELVWESRADKEGLVLCAEDEDGGDTEGTERVEGFGRLGGADEDAWEDLLRFATHLVSARAEAAVHSVRFSSRLFRIHSGI